MHAVFVLPRFYPYRGGYENSILAIGRCLVGRGHRVTVFTTTADALEALWLPGYKTFPATTFDLDGISVRRFPVCYNRLRRRMTRLAGLLSNWRCKAQFWRPGFRVPGLHAALRNTDSDVFHIGPLPYNNLMYAGLQAGEFRHVPVIATPCIHLGESGNQAIAKDYAQPHQIALLKRCDRVVCMTEIEQMALANLGVPLEKMTVIPYGADLQKATGGDAGRLQKQHGIDGPVVLHLGMKAFDKGSITLVEAMKVLWARGSNAWLVMAGPSLSTFDQYVALHGPGSPRLVNLPAFADEEKRDLLAAATVVAQPSRVESLGLVLVEAWASAKPVIAADIDVSRHLVCGSGGGLVVPFGESAQLADAIEKLLHEPGLHRTMGLHGQEFALANFDSHKLWTRAAQEFERVATAHGGTSDLSEA